MDLRQIRYFVAVKETQSMLSAARLLNISQPALSKRIKDLENSLGEKLFSRHARGVLLTDSGKKFALHANEILAAIDRASTIFEAPISVKSQFSIGATPTPCKVLMPAVLKIAQRTLPELRITVHQASTRPLFEMLARREVDAILSYSTPRRKDICIHPLFVEECYLVGPLQNTKLFGDEIAFGELRDIPLVLDPTTHATRRKIEENARRRKLPLDIVGDIEPWEAKKAAVQEQNCYTIVPYSVCSEDVNAGRLVASRLIEPTISSTLHMVHLSSTVTKPVEALKNILEAIVQQCIMDGDLRWQKTIGECAS